MIHFDFLVDRGFLDPKDDFVQYEKAVKEALEELETFRRCYTAKEITSDELYKKMLDALKQELKHCQFHREILSRRKDEPNFNQWIFTRKEDIKSLYGWRPPEGDEWTRTNGRIKATIRIIKKEKSTSVQASYRNDSKELTFIDQYNEGNSKPKSLKNEDSINQYVKELKEEADNRLSNVECMYPRWNAEKQNLEGLNKLLHILPVETEPKETEILI